MILVGPTHALAATLPVFAAGSAYREPYSDSGATRALAAGTSATVGGYLWSSASVQSPDLGGGVAGPDYLWWKTSVGDWVPDAILDTTGLAGAPSATPPASEVMTSLYVTQDVLSAAVQGALGAVKPAPHDHGLAAATLGGRTDKT